jgi:hypothetical protein
MGNDVVLGEPTELPKELDIVGSTEEKSDQIWRCINGDLVTLPCGKLSDADAMVAMSVGEEHCVDTILATDLSLLWSR